MKALLNLCIEKNIHILEEDGSSENNISDPLAIISQSILPELLENFVAQVVKYFELLSYYRKKIEKELSSLFDIFLE